MTAYPIGGAESFPKITQPQSPKTICQRCFPCCYKKRDRPRIRHQREMTAYDISVERVDRISEAARKTLDENKAWT